MARFDARRLARALLAPASLLMLLEFYARAVAPDSDTIAAPSRAVGALAGMLPSLAFWGPVGFTLGCAAAGLVLGGGLGVLVGLVLGVWRTAADVSALSIEMLRPVPSIALAPLALIFFGFGFALEISIVAFACFWPVLVLTKAAVGQVEPRLLEVARVLCLTPAMRTRDILLPALVPRLFVALRLASAVALVVAVTVEIAINPHGMGYALVSAQQSLQPAAMLGWLLTIAVLGFAVSEATGWLEARAGRWMAA